MIRRDGGYCMSACRQRRVAGAARALTAAAIPLAILGLFSGPATALDRALPHGRTVSRHSSRLEAGPRLRARTAPLRSHWRSIRLVRSSSALPAGLLRPLTSLPHGLRSSSRRNLTGPSSNPRSTTFIGRCSSVLDGDTIYVEHDGQTDKVDLWGVDCPELGQPFGLQARQYTVSRAYNQTVRVHVRGRGPDGRLLGWVDLTSGSTLNEDLIGNGMAWWVRQQAHDELLLPLLEDTAHQDKRGLWADKDPVPPARWRHAHGE